MAIESGLYEALKAILQELKDEHPDTGYWVRIDHPDLGNNISNSICIKNIYVRIFQIRLFLDLCGLSKMIVWIMWSSITYLP